MTVSPVAPNNVSCNTVLPNGQTVGQVVQQCRYWLQGALSEPVAWPFETESLLSDIAKSNGPIDFKNIFRGQGNATTLCLAGNFAFYAIGVGILPNWELDAGASAYALNSAARGKKSFSSLTLTGLWIVDDSAASIRDSALASNGCKQ
jgi:hypothetical protein